MIRNRVIADLAAAVVVAHADPDSDSKVGALALTLAAASPSTPSTTPRTPLFSTAARKMSASLT